MGQVDTRNHHQRNNSLDGSRQCGRTPTTPRGISNTTKSTQAASGVSNVSRNSKRHSDFRSSDSDHQPIQHSEDRGRREEMKDVKVLQGVRGERKCQEGDIAPFVSLSRDHHPIQFAPLWPKQYRGLISQSRAETIVRFLAQDKAKTS